MKNYFIIKIHCYQAVSFKINLHKKKSGLKPLSRNKTLAMTYFHMGKPHTIIGARSFHF